jgi:hypothetical protein
LYDLLDRDADQGVTLDLDLDDFYTFILTATPEEARMVAFEGATTLEDKRRASEAFSTAIASLIKQGRIVGSEVVERIAVAGQLQLGIVA